MTADLKAHAGRLRELHHAGEMLVLPNVWDAASAKIVAEAGFPVIATARTRMSNGLRRARAISLRNIYSPEPRVWATLCPKS